MFAAIDFNDYFSSGANLGFIGSSRVTLADIVAGFGQNAASVSIAPVFVSATDLHLNTIGNATLENLGTPIATVTTDIDNDARSAVNPDMGADEINFLTVNQFDVTDGFKAYPNPVSNMLTIEFTSDLTQVSVFNLVGQEVLSRKVNATSTQIDLSRLEAGTYLVKVEAGSVSKTLKVFKK